MVKKLESPEQTTVSWFSDMTALEGLSLFASAVPPSSSPALLATSKALVKGQRQGLLKYVFWIALNVKTCFED